MEASALTTASHSGLLARRSPLLRLQSDERLVALIRDGHDRAFEVLFDRYQVRLLGFCRHMVRSAPDAEDLLQEVFVAAHAAMLADDRPINARPWLYRIARNRCLNHLRRPVADGQDTMDVHPHANGTTTFERVQKREELRTIVADVQDLPETQRTALVLREIDGLSYTEIAQTMGVTLASVKSLLVRSRMALAEASEARILACDDVRLELAEAAEGIGKISGAARRHVKECRSCKRFRGELRSTSRSIATLAPFGLFAVVGKFVGSMFGGGGSAGSASGSAGAGAGAAGAGAAGSGAAGAGAAGSVGAAGSLGGAAAAAGGSGITLGGALGTVGGVVGAKAAVGVATAALITAGAVGAKKFSEEPQPAPSKPVAAAPAHPTKEWSVEHSRAEVATVVAKPAPAVTAAAVPTEAPAAEPAPPQAPPVTTEATPATDTAPAPNPATEPVEAATGTAVDDTGGTGATDDGTTDDGIAGGSSNENDDDTGEDPDPDPPPVVVPPPPDSDLAPPPTDPPPLTE
jgi:RNA polymerase sigma factor (sigma-70 family)